MPNIIGWQQEDAVSELRRAGLTSAVYVMENDGTYASGCVVKCSAEPGEELPAGTTITVYIAADRDVIIPPTPTPSAEPTPTPIPDLEEDFD